MRHAIVIETRKKTGHRRDPIVQRWSCSCGAGSPTSWSSPDHVQEQVERHEREGRGGRKAFAFQQPVEIQREPRTAWEPATYLGPSSDPGWHCVLLPSSAPGVAVQLDGYHSIGAHRTHVPARRIRVRKETR